MAKTTKQGTIIKKNDQRTVVVQILGTKTHPIYKKRFKVTKKYLADDSKNQYQIGDVVVIEECRPISKTKHFKVIKKLGSANMLGKEKIEGEEVLGAERVDVEKSES